jgi:hypothetical protein
MKWMKITEISLSTLDLEHRPRVLRVRTRHVCWHMALQNTRPRESLNSLNLRFGLWDDRRWSHIISYHIISLPHIASTFAWIAYGTLGWNYPHHSASLSPTVQAGVQQGVARSWYVGVRRIRRIGQPDVWSRWGNASATPRSSAMG